MPPRTNSIPASQSDPPPPPYSPDASDGYINQGATSRLAQSGVSVPALGIGDDGSQERRDSQPVNELQSRFSQMRTSRPAPPPPPSRSATANDSPVSASSPGGIRSTVSDFRERHSDKIDAGKQKVSGINEKYGITRSAPPPPPSRSATTNDSPTSPSSSGGIRSTVSDFRERHSDKIDAGKQKISGIHEKYGSTRPAPPPPGTRDDPSSPSTSGSGGVRATVGDFRERHSDKIDAGKQKMSGINEKYISRTAPPPPSQGTDTHNEQSSGGGIKGTVSDLRERHGDKIDTGKQKISGINEKYAISQRARDFVDNQKSAPSSGQRPPAPPRPQPSRPSVSSPVDVEAVSRKKPPPPPPPKRAEIRASSVNEPASTPPPLPLSTKPR